VSAKASGNGVDVNSRSCKATFFESTSRTIRLLLSVALLLITIHRLPAPISESPETPTPSPAPPQSSTSQSRRHPGTSWKSLEPEPSAGLQPSPKRTLPTQPTQQGAVRFAGTWTGKVKLGISGDVQFTLTVNPEATSLKQKSMQFGEHSHATSYAAQTLSWKAGPKNETVWTLTPNRDGQTASVTAKSGSQINGTAVFHRVQPNPGPAQAKSPLKEHPGTKLRREDRPLQP
jgi:hypothetical protein